MDVNLAKKRSLLDEKFNLCTKNLSKTVAPIRNCFKNTTFSLKVKFIQLYSFFTGVMSKQLQSNSQPTLKKSRKMGFQTLKIVKITRAKLEPKFQFQRSYIKLSSQNYDQKFGLLKPKTMPKQLLNNSETTLKKPRKCVFQPQNYQNMDLNLAQKGRFLAKIQFSAKIWTVNVAPIQNCF